MSEPTDKPEPSKPAASRPRPASPSAVDSDWDALLGASSSASDRPIFAPPGGKPSRALTAPESTSRSSRARASVSGEFEVSEPQAEPAIPSRLRTIELEDEEGELRTHLQLVPRSDTLDDADADPATEAAARSSDPSPAEVQHSGASRKLLFIVLGIAALASIALFVSRDGDEREQAASSELKQPRREEPIEPAPHEPSLEASETTTSGEAASETETGESGGEPEPAQPPKPVDPRDPSLIPPGTPEENAKAFLKLPVSIHDGPPIGGIGRSGVHIDKVSTARGRENTDCKDPTQRFSISADEYANVCIRVVHPRQQETLRVIWEKDGKVTRRGWVRIPDAHAYTTRAYLLLRPEYVGSWRVRIVPEGEDVDLAVASFTVTE